MKSDNIIALCKGVYVSLVTVMHLWFSCVFTTSIRQLLMSSGTESGELLFFRHIISVLNSNSNYFSV